MRNMLIPFLIAVLSLGFVTDKPAYRIYNPGEGYSLFKNGQTTCRCRYYFLRGTS